MVDPSGAAGDPAGSGGIKKFVDTLPGLGAANANDLGQYIPLDNTSANQNAGDGYAPANWKGRLPTTTGSG